MVSWKGLWHNCHGEHLVAFSCKTVAFASVAVTDALVASLNGRDDWRGMSRAAAVHRRVETGSIEG